MPVARRSAAEISSRADTLSELAHRQLWNPKFVHLAAEYRPPTGMILAEAYFALTDAYKKRWGLTGLTEGTKVAAITAATIAAIKPIRPAPTNFGAGPTDPAWLYVNPSFAMFAAYDGIPHAFYGQDFDEQMRLLRSLRDLRLLCLEPLIEEANANNGVLKTTWDFGELDGPDAAYLDVLVCYFETLKREQRLRGVNP